jgi:bla regulator protein blaR1
MGDVARFVAQCVASGGILVAACALLIVPFVAWAALRCILPALRRMHGDPEWQAPLAAAAASIPGALLLLMAATVVIAGRSVVCTQTYTGRALFGAFAAFTLVSLVRASVRAIRRVREARALLSLTAAPSPRLARLAARSGIAVRELPDPRPFCALAGSFAPVAIVSSGTLAELSDDELRAALLHERGHARRRDQIVAAMVAFCADLLPLPARELIALYHDAREVAADRHALRGANAEDLAGALLAFARGQRAFAHLARLTGESGISERLRALLEARAVARASVPLRVAVVVALALVSIAGLNPVRAAAVSLATPAAHGAVPSEVRPAVGQKRGGRDRGCEQRRSASASSARA